jgi:hypothetical protein
MLFQPAAHLWAAGFYFAAAIKSPPADALGRVRKAGFYGA